MFFFWEISTYRDGVDICLIVFLLVSCRLILISFIVRGTLAIFFLLHKIQLMVFKIRLPSRSLWRETCFTLKLLDHWWVGLGFSSKLIMTWKMALSCSEDQDSSIPAFFTSILKTLFVDVCCVFLSAMVSLFRFHLPFQRCNFQMSETPPGPLDAWKTGGIFESSGGDGNDAPGAF